VRDFANALAFRHTGPVQTTEPGSAITRTIAGPWGPLHLAATTRGIVAVESAVTDDAFLAAVARRVHGPVVPEREAAPDDPRRIHLDRAAAVIADLVAGRAPRGAVPPIDLEDRPDWDRRVLGEVRAVGWGETASYGEIARRIGAPRAARAVGGALGRNPISLLVPCHRVIAADGTIGGYGGDAWGSRESALERKRTLLLREGIAVAVRDGER
jgi:methylated-DNA-[protein]-cysteine S-methyltransferase